jgi:hypothetical protein
MSISTEEIRPVLDALVKNQKEVSGSQCHIIADFIRATVDRWIDRLILMNKENVGANCISNPELAKGRTI